MLALNAALEVQIGQARRKITQKHVQALAQRGRTPQRKTHRAMKTLGERVNPRHIPVRLFGQRQRVADVLQGLTHRDAPIGLREIGDRQAGIGQQRIGGEQSHQQTTVSSGH